MSRVIVLVLLAGCWLTAGPLLAAPVLAAPVLAGPVLGPATWVWPVDGPRAVSRPFAPPASRYGSGHRGADLLSTPGAAVRAAGSGRVSYAGLLAGRGVVVVVHGALRTTYEPVTSTVPVGAEVTSGQPLGRLEAGHVGCAAPACLHWGLRRGEDYLDPVRLLQQGPMRLLPLNGAAASGGDPAQAPSTGRVQALVQARAEGAPVAGTTLAYVPEPAPGVPPVAVPVAADLAGRSGPAGQIETRTLAVGSTWQPPAAGLDGALVLTGATRDRTVLLWTVVVLSLVTGVALLARPRPRRPPPGPATGATAQAPAPLDAAPTGPVVLRGSDAEVLELVVERRRRRGS